MEYNEIKLGLIGKLRVWNERRIAEAKRDQYYKDEGELLEVDYSSADKLEEELLEQKRIKKATRDAKKLYKRVYGKNNDGMGEADFIENYLMDNGLIQKALPQPSTKTHDFMSKYPTEKTQEEIAYEKANEKFEAYYRIGDKEYKIDLIEYYLKDMENKGTPIKLQAKGNGKYLILDDEMEPERKYDLIWNMLDKASLHAMGWMNEYLTELGDEQLVDRKNSLCRNIDFTEYHTKKLCSEGKIDEATSKLTTRLEEVLKFEQEVLQTGKQEETR